MSSLKEDMSLDEYYQQCVLPKPNIPPCYPGVNGNSRKYRQGSRFFSYKDQGSSSDEDSDDETEENVGKARRLYSHKKNEMSFNEDIEMQDMDGLEHNDTNSNQINYEMNNFNEIYEEEDSTVSNQEMPTGSAQWRIQPNNVNRPAGAPPLVPNNVPQTNVKSRLYNKGETGFRNQWKRKNNHQNQQFRNIQNRLGRPPNRQQHQQTLEHGMRNTFNAFNYPDLHNNTVTINQGKPNSSDVLSNINRHFPQNYFIHVRNESQNSTNSNTIGSLIDTVTNLSNRVQNRNRMVCSGNSNMNPNDSVLLGDLVKIDSNVTRGINVQEIASNVLMLLQNVVHKPVLDQEVQKEINYLQQTEGNPNPGVGIDLAFLPEATQGRMSHRFQ